MSARLRIWILVLAMACGCTAARQALSGLLEPAIPAISASLVVAPRSVTPEAVVWRSPSLVTVDAPQVTPVVAAHDQASARAPPVA